MSGALQRPLWESLGGGGVHLVQSTRLHRSSFHHPSNHAHPPASLAACLSCLYNSLTWWQVVAAPPHPKQPIFPLSLTSSCLGLFAVRQEDEAPAATGEGISQSMASPCRGKLPGRTLPPSCLPLPRSLCWQQRGLCSGGRRCSLQGEATWLSSASFPYLPKLPFAHYFIKQPLFGGQTLIL